MGDFECLPKSGASDVKALTSLISTSVDNILSEYASLNKSLPHLDSVEDGPFDLPADASFDLARNTRIVEAACAQLVAIIASPAHLILNHTGTTCIFIAIQAKIADSLRDKPEGLHVERLSELCGVDQKKLYRVLRLLATMHIFTELRPSVFANNRLSIKLLSSDPMSSLMGDGIENGMKALCHLPAILSDSELTASQNINDAAFSKAFGSPFFDYYAAHEKEGVRFNHGMVAWAKLTGTTMLARAFPWNLCREGTTICDVGAGKGHVTLSVLKQHPHTKAVIQDTPAVIEDAHKMWNEELPDAIPSARVRLVPLNFLKEVPVTGCDVYYLRHVLHDWPDAECRIILENVKKAMTKPEARVLINELSPQSSARNDTRTNGKSAASDAPPPLLPNYGMADIRKHCMDVHMMTLCNSKERTKEEFIELALSVGLAYSTSYDAGELSLFEFVV